MKKMHQLDVSGKVAKLERYFIIGSNLNANQPKSNKNHHQSNGCLSHLPGLFVGTEHKNCQSSTRCKIKPGPSQKVLELMQDQCRVEARGSLEAEQLIFILRLRRVDRYLGET